MLPAEGGEQKDWGKRGEILFPNGFTAKSGKFGSFTQVGCQTSWC